MIETTAAFLGFVALGITLVQVAFFYYGMDEPSGHVERILRPGSSSESWIVTPTFDGNGHLASRLGRTQAKSL